MRNQDFISLITSHVQEHGGNKYAAYEAAGQQLYENILSGKVRKNEISIKSLFEACLMEAYPNGGFSLATETQRLAEAVGSSSFPNITKYIISSEAIPKFEYNMNRVAPLFTEGTASRTDVERIAGFTANEGVEYVPEQYPVQETDFHEKYAEIFLAKFQRSISLTKEAIYNDNTGQIISRAASLGEVAGEQMEKMLIQTIEVLPRTILPYETTSNLGCAKFDGNTVTNAIFYSTDHSSYSYMGSQINANKATSAALSNTSLETAVRLFPIMTDERGEYIAVNPKTLLVHTNNQVTAWQLTNTITQPDTANRADNYWKGAFNVVVSPYLYTPTTWYMGDFPKQLVLLYWQRPNVVSQSGNFESSFTSDIVMRWKFSLGAGAGHRDYRYIAQLAA